MDIETKLDLVCRNPVEEVLTRDELRTLFESNDHPTHYIGYEISGKLHIGSGVLTAMKIKDFMQAGVKPTILLADYHTWINNKLGGDLKKIQEVALGYFKAGFVSLGLTDDKVNYVLASDIYDKEYWANVIKVAKNTTIARMTRCMVIMGRTEAEAVESASLLYPAMQAADAFKLDVDIMQAGMDQRKVHVLAREVSEKLKIKKPIAIHGHLLSGLQQASRMGYDVDVKTDMAISGKMSKSKPGSCIYLHDTEEEIAKKLNDAFCPVKIIEGNPIIELCEYVLLHETGSKLNIERPAKFGGDVQFADIASLKKDYAEGKLHPMDLKKAVTKDLALYLKPCRDYFAAHPEYLEQINGAMITR